MRVRLFVGSVIALLIAALIAVALPGSLASARLQDAATPAAATPEAEGETEAEEETPQTVTLIALYAPSEDGDVLVLSQVRTNNAHVASQVTDNARALTGEVDFEDGNNDGLPRISLGESDFDAYPLNPDDPESVFRWLYLNDDPSLRPATLVLQIEAVDGPYDGYSGTATFVSRGAEVGGVLVIVLNPPAEEE